MPNNDVENYISSIEGENVVLRTNIVKLHKALAQNLRKTGNEPTGNHRNCHSLMMSGWCGGGCPLFKEGSCENPEGVVSFLKEQIKSNREIIEKYEVNKANSKTLSDNRGCS